MSPILQLKAVHACMVCLYPAKCWISRTRHGTLGLGQDDATKAQHEAIVMVLAKPHCDSALETLRRFAAA